MSSHRHFRKLIRPLLIAAVALGTASVPAVVHVFPSISLQGANVRPTPVSSDGSGSAEVVYNDVTNTIYWTVVYTLDTSSTTLSAAHFHGPADTSTAAGIQIDMTPSVSSASGFWSSSATLTEPQEADLLAGMYYINLHSDQHAGGELRGQVIEAAATQSFADRPVDSSQEVGGITGSPGAGEFNGAYDSNTNSFTFSVTWNGLTGPVTGAHFHGPASAGANAGIRVPLDGLPGFDTGSATGLFTGSVSLDNTMETELLSDMWYINLHTATNTGGEVRGQIDGAVLVPVELSVFTAD